MSEEQKKAGVAKPPSATQLAITAFNTGAPSLRSQAEQIAEFRNNPSVSPLLTAAGVPLLLSAKTKSSPISQNAPNLVEKAVQSRVPVVKPVTATIRKEQEAVKKIGDDFNKGVIAGSPKSVVAQSEATQPIDYITSRDLVDVIEGLRDGSQFQDNPLDGVHVPSYHFKFFITPDRDLMWKATNGQRGSDAPKTVRELHNRLDQLPKVMIAETGVTGFTIQSVTIENTAKPGFSDSAQNTHNIAMTIVEPLGISFPDALLEAAKSVQIRDYQKCWYYLELGFKGYSDGSDGQEGTPLTNALGGAGFSNNGRWIWPVFINDIRVQHELGFTTYTLTMTPTSENALSSEYSSAPDAVHATGETIGKMLASVAEELNQSWAIRYGDRYPDPTIIQHRFKFHNVPMRGLTADQIKDWSLTPKIPDESPIRSLSMGKDKENNNKTTVTVPKGTSVEDIVKLVFANCERAQILAKDSSEQLGYPDDSGEKVNERGFRECLLFSTQPEVRIAGYDFLIGQYWYDITWHVRPYITQEPILSLAQIESAKSQVTQQKMVSALVENKFLTKRYDYINTGNNLSVISLDLSFNLAWSALIPRLVYYGIDQNTVGPKICKISKDISDVGIKKTDPFTSLSNAADAVDKATGDYTATAVDDEEGRVKADKVLNEAKANLKVAYATLVEKRIALQQQYLNGGYDPWSSSEAGKLTYAEDLEPTEKEIQVSLKHSFDSAGQEVGDGMEGQIHAGKTIYGAILNQVKGTLTSQYINITMEIRGDPYWIGPGTLDNFVLTNDDLPDSGLAKYGKGDTTILLTYRYPIKSDDNAQPIFDTNETYSGFYVVTGVVNNFTNGQFNQTLTAHKMPLVSFAQVMGVSVEDLASQQTQTLKNEARDGQSDRGINSVPIYDLNAISSPVDLLAQTNINVNSATRNNT